MAPAIPDRRRGVESSVVDIDRPPQAYFHVFKSIRPGVCF
jgi:hypothetical protein